MHEGKVETSNERILLNRLQESIGAQQNDYLGMQTLSDLVRDKGLDVWPRTLRLFGQSCIIANDILLAADPGTGVGGYKNSLSGSFTYPAGRTPCSIMVAHGKTIYGGSCHGHLGKPETVLYLLQDGSFGTLRTMYAADLPAGVRWAVGGLGLCDMHDPEAEGFCRLQFGGKWYDYSDVLRKTNHTVLGCKGQQVYLIYCRDMTGAQVQQLIRDRFKLDHAIMLDGGSLAAINGAEDFAQINLGTRQGYLIQGV